MVFLNENKYREDAFLIFREINVEIFKVSILSYLFFVLLETITPGFAKGIFDLNIILYIAVISGVITMFFNSDPLDRKKNNIKVSDYILIILFGLGSMAFTYFQIKSISDFEILVSITTGIIIIIISYLIINNEVE